MLWLLAGRYFFLGPLILGTGDIPGAAPTSEGRGVREQIAARYAAISSNLPSFQLLAHLLYMLSAFKNKREQGEGLLAIAGGDRGSCVGCSCAFLVPSQVKSVLSTQIQMCLLS